MSKENKKVGQEYLTHTKTRAAPASHKHLGGGVGGTGIALAVPQNCECVVQRGNIKDAIEMSARQHVINERTRIHQLEMGMPAFSPAM
jgi:hypothetical protein